MHLKLGDQSLSGIANDKLEIMAEESGEGGMKLGVGIGAGKGKGKVGAMFAHSYAVAQ